MIAGTKFDTVYTLNNLKDYAGQLGPNFPPDKLYFIQPQGMLAITPIHHELHVIKEEIKKSRKDGITAEECDEIVKKRNEELLESFGAKKVILPQKLIIHKQVFIIIYIFMALMGVQSKNFRNHFSRVNYKI